MKNAVSESTRARNRSPAHPAFDLKTAIARARLFYDGEHFAWTPLTTALRHWGYGPKSSSGLRTLAALRHFALLDETGRGNARRFRLSALAKTILLHEVSDAERQEAIRTAALKPPIHAKLWVAWGVGSSLPSQVSMRYQLETEWGFNPNAIGLFVADLRATLEFAGLISSAVISAHETQSGQTTQNANGWNAGVKSDFGDFTIPLGDAGVAVLSIPAPLSEHDYTQLQQWLKWAHDGLVCHGEDAE